jgi:hypothetical protein
VVKFFHEGEIHAGSHPAFTCEDESQLRRAVWCGRGVQRQNRRARLESRHVHERPDGARGSLGHPRRLQKAQDFPADDCELYTSCEPCPMCLAAIYWARFKKVFYANTRKDAAKIQFDDDLIYREVSRPISRRLIPMKQLLRIEALKVFKEWNKKPDKTLY